MRYSFIRTGRTVQGPQVSATIATATVVHTHLAILDLEVVQKSMQYVLIYLICGKINNFRLQVKSMFRCHRTDGYDDDDAGGNSGLL
jgi:hypothetical protein